MDALNATSSPPPGGNLDLSWSKPAVKLLLVTGVALAVLGALVLIGVNTPIAALALLGKTFTSFGAGFMMGSGLVLFLYTAISTFVVLRQPKEGKQQPQEAPTETEPVEPSSSFTGHPRTPIVGPAPIPFPETGRTGARNAGNGPSNVTFKQLDN